MDYARPAGNPRSEARPGAWLEGSAGIEVVSALERTWDSPYATAAPTAKYIGLRYAAATLGRVSTDDSWPGAVHPSPRALVQTPTWDIAIELLQRPKKGALLSVLSRMALWLRMARVFGQRNVIGSIKIS